MGLANTTVVLVYDGCYADKGRRRWNPFASDTNMYGRGGQGDGDDGNQRGPEISAGHEC